MNTALCQERNRKLNPKKFNDHWWIKGAGGQWPRLVPPCLKSNLLVAPMVDKTWSSAHWVAPSDGQNVVKYPLFTTNIPPPPLIVVPFYFSPLPLKHPESTTGKDATKKCKVLTYVWFCGNILGLPKLLQCSITEQNFTVLTVYKLIINHCSSWKSSSDLCY